MTIEVEFFVEKRMKRGLKGPAINRALKDAAKEIKKQFEKTTRTWTTQVEFKTEIKKDSARVWTDNDIYRYVNDGTPAHRIPKSGEAFMRFQRGYTAKTTPGKISSKRGGPKGEFVMRKVVNHPGIKQPRKFDVAIQKFYQPKFEKRMIKAMEEQIFPD